MIWIRNYLLSIVFCGFLISLATVIPMQKTVKKVVILCGSCLMILTVMKPLIRIDPADLPDILPELYTDREVRLQEAERRNEALMQDLIREQTITILEQKAREFGICASFQVTLKKDEASGLYLPDSVTVVSDCSESLKGSMEQYLTEELGIPPERQIWSLP